jgi:hypothetical protein
MWIFPAWSAFRAASFSFFTFGRREKGGVNDGTSTLLKRLPHAAAALREIAWVAGSCAGPVSLEKPAGFFY